MNMYKLHHNRGPKAKESVNPMPTKWSGAMQPIYIVALGYQKYLIDWIVNLFTS